MLMTEQHVGSSPHDAAFWGIRTKVTDIATAFLPRVEHTHRYVEGDHAVDRRITQWIGGVSDDLLRSRACLITAVNDST